MFVYDLTSNIKERGFDNHVLIHRKINEARLQMAEQIAGAR